MDRIEKVDTIEDTSTSTENSREFPQWVEELMEDDRVREFINDRKIKNEDLDLIRRSLLVSHDVWLDTHNNIKLLMERFPKQIAHDVTVWRQKVAVDPTDRNKDYLEWAEIMNEITIKYDWGVAFGLNTTMENVTPKKIHPMQ